MDKKQRKLLFNNNIQAMLNMRENAKITSFMNAFNEVCIVDDNNIWVGVQGVSEDDDSEEQDDSADNL